LDIQRTPPGAPIPIESARSAVAARRSGGDGSTASEGAERFDAVELSDEARQLARIDAGALQTARDRAELIMKLKAAVGSGAYHVNLEALAEAMLERDNS
jgi:flagellar biosynthesis anti-sigma factor FlgM